MKIENVLLVVKQTALTWLQRDDSAGTRKMKRLIEREDQSVAGIRPAHAEHEASVTLVRNTLRDLGINIREQRRIPRRPVSGVDMVITVGGDGMVLGVSHAVHDDTPVLGVNSAPSFSVGYLTGCAASGLSPLLERLAAGDAQPRAVQRLAVKLGARVLPEPVLNDALFCADNPAVMCRYRLVWPDGEELQRSSGVWISTPAGSTSALASAGGPILPLGAKQFAFLVREPYAPPGVSVRIRSAVLAKEEQLAIECRTMEASVFLDGSHRRYPLPFGDMVSFTLHPQPLALVRGR